MRNINRSHSCRIHMRRKSNKQTRLCKTPNFVLVPPCKTQTEEFCSARHTWRCNNTVKRAALSGWKWPESCTGNAIHFKNSHMLSLHPKASQPLLLNVSLFLSGWRIGTGLFQCCHWDVKFATGPVHNAYAVCETVVSRCAKKEKSLFVLAKQSQRVNPILGFNISTTNNVSTPLAAYGTDLDSRSPDDAARPAVGILWDFQLEQRDKKALNKQSWKEGHESLCL